MFVGGWIEDAHSSRRFSKGALVEEFTAVVYKCISGLPPTGEINNLCFKGKWQREAPKCEVVCDTSPIRDTSISSLCDIGGVQTPCSGYVKSGTQAVITCQKGYERGESDEQISHCSESGTWSPKPKPCSPICGIPKSEVKFGIGRHRLPDYSVMPWIAGIYRTNWFNRLVCIGTIINARVVGFSAHCLTRASDMETFNATDIRVVVGELRSGTLTESYSGEANQTIRAAAIWQTGYQDLPNTRIRDFGLIILEKDIIFGDVVAPICIEFGAKNFVPKGELGYYIGYEEQVEGDLPPLDAMVVQVLEGKDCKEHVADWFKPHFSDEAFCTGPMNETDKGICGGENGSSLTIPKEINGRTVFFLHGFLSVYEKNDGCQSQVHVVVSSVHYFQDFFGLVGTHKPR